MMRNKTSIRKGCFWCGNELLSFKEKVTRACDTCAKDTLKGANKIKEGKVKEGIDQMKAVATARFGGKEILDAKIKAATTRKQKKIIKKAKKKGISEEEALEAIKIFDGK